ncbi:MAG: DUF2065 domain-containing protein [Micavibrio sp.]|nr:MAG: DUF2065 domain-containing protein [Micavibrio sp.]
MYIEGRDILLAFGLMMFMEGMLYALIPRDILRRMFLYVADLPGYIVKLGALSVATFGMVVIWTVLRT